MSYLLSNSNLSSIKYIVDSFTDAITQQNAQIATLETTMASIVSSGGTGGASIADLSALQTSVADLQAVVGTNASTSLLRLDDLEERIEDLETSSITNTINISTNASAIGVLQSAETTTANAITGLNTTTSTNTLGISALNGAMVLIANRSNDNSAAIATNTTNISNNTTDISATNVIVSDHTTAIAALEVPGFVATQPTLRWDFRDFFDTRQGIEFVPIPSDGVEIIDQKAVVDLPGPLHFLRGFVPIGLVSKFSKTLMFRFKSIPDMDPNVDFVFSTFSGDPRFALGFAVRVFNGGIETKVYGGYGPSGSKAIYSALHPIPGYPSVIFNQYVHMCVVIDTSNGFITTYINGAQNGSTNAVTSGTTQAELDAGEYHAGVSFLPFFVNKAGDAGNGNALYDQIDYFDNVALSQQDITYYYNESI